MLGSVFRKHQRYSSAVSRSAKIWVNFRVNARVNEPFWGKLKWHKGWWVGYGTSTISGHLFHRLRARMLFIPRLHESNTSLKKRGPRQESKPPGHSGESGAVEMTRRIHARFHLHSREQNDARHKIFNADLRLETRWRRRFVSCIYVYARFCFTLVYQVYNQFQHRAPSRRLTAHH